MPKLWAGPRFTVHEFSDDLFTPRWPVSINAPVYRLMVKWPDGSQSTEVTSCQLAAERRTRYLTKPIDPWVLAFRGTTADLYYECGLYFRAQSVDVDIHFQPRLRDVFGEANLIEGLDADWIINKYWSAPA